MQKGSIVRRLISALLATFVFSCVIGVQPATAKPDRKLQTTLAELWKTILETPKPDNPFGTGDSCVELGSRVVAPFGPLGDEPTTCTVRPGTKIFVTAVSWECSTVETPPSYGADEAQLRACAREAVKGFTSRSITVDGRPVEVTRVETPLIPLDLPVDNILEVSPQPALSVGVGWVALLKPLPPGTHRVVIRYSGTDPFGKPVNVTNPTTIIVKRGR